jgi:hypothetical protein
MRFSLRIKVNLETSVEAFRHNELACGTKPNISCKKQKIALRIGFKATNVNQA